jgi:hypothetical protein
MAEKLARKSEPKMPKMPKSLGACVDLYYELRQERLAAEKAADAIKVREQFAFDHIINSIPKGDGGAVGKRFKAIRTETAQYSIEKDEDFYAFIKKTGSFDLLNRAINQKAVRERLEDPKFLKRYPTGVPGTKKFVKIGLSVTKVG